MITKTTRNAARKKRHQRIRRKVHGTSERPRLTVYRSNKHIYAQLIDDEAGHTVISASTNEKDASLDHTSNIEAAKYVGEQIAKRAKDAGIETIVFDRSGYKYHGRVKALADAAREAGLQF